MTLSLPRALLRKIKVVAATRDTSISALLTGALEEIATQDDDQRRRAVRRTLAKARQGYDLGTHGRRRVDRGDLHAR